MSHAILALTITLSAIALGIVGARRGSSSSLVIACVLGAIGVFLHVAEVLLA